MVRISLLNVQYHAVSLNKVLVQIYKLRCWLHHIVFISYHFTFFHQKSYAANCLEMQQIEHRKGHNFLKKHIRMDILLCGHIIWIGTCTNFCDHRELSMVPVISDYNFFGKSMWKHKALPCTTFFIWTITRLTFWKQKTFRSVIG